MTLIAFSLGVICGLLLAWALAPFSRRKEPELLMALQTILLADAEGTNEEWIAALEVARSAVTKATGETT